MSADQASRSNGGAEVAAYIQAILAAVSLFYNITNDWSFSSFLPPAAFSAALAVAVLVTVYLARRGPAAALFVAAASVIALGVIVVASWINVLSQTPTEDAGGGDDTRPPVATPTDQDNGETPSQTELQSLCAEPPVVATHTWFLYENSGGTSQVVIEEDGRPASSFDGSAFSAAGSRLIHVDAMQPSRVVVVNIATGDPVATTIVKGRVTDTTISHDGETVVLLENRSGDTRLVLWRPSTDEMEVLHDPRASVFGPSLAPAGDRLAWVQGVESSGDVVVADLDAFVMRTIAENGSDPAWSPDGSTIVYTDTHSDGRAVFAVTDSGGDRRRLTNPIQAVDSDPAVAPSCDRVVYARANNGTVDLWVTSLDDGSEATFREVTGAQSRPAFAAN